MKTRLASCLLQNATLAVGRNRRFRSSARAATATRRRLLSFMAAGAATLAFAAHAQWGGRGHSRGEGASARSGSASEPGTRVPPAPADPLAAVERELPSLRIDLKLTAEQGPLFDSFERQVRNAAEAARLRARHVAAYRTDDASAITAKAIVGTLADDDDQRAEAARQSLARLTALYETLSPDQRTQFDRRIIQALRDPLGGGR